MFVLPPSAIRMVLSRALPIAIAILVAAGPVLAQPQDVSDAAAAEAARPGIALAGSSASDGSADNSDAANNGSNGSDAAGALPQGEAAEVAKPSALETAVAEAPAAFDWDMIIQPIRTDSPRRTMRSIARLIGNFEATIAAYRDNKTAENLERLELDVDRFLSLIDLSSVPPAARRELGITTMTHLLDIFGRIGLPSADDIPGEGAFAEGEPAVWRIPETPIRLVRIESGPRRFEFLISAEAVNAAPRFAESIAALPLKSELPITSWSTTWPQLTGSLIPTALVRAVPEEFRGLWLDTPVWKVIALFAISGLAVVVLLAFNRAIKPLRSGDGRWPILFRFILPLTALGTIVLLDWFFQGQINLSGRFAVLAKLTETGLFYGGLAWVVWAAANGVFGCIIASPNVEKEGLNASLLRLTARLTGMIGGVAVITIGVSNLGFPVYSLLAGLGVGGLAIALAVRPTLENLIGGIVLFADRPVRVGDFCTFGAFSGNVESIGLRSTQIRGLDRTLIAIPNAKFADMEITNWAQCDRMLIHQYFPLRYETTTDQLRYALARFREMFYAHPRIDPDTIRVRLSSYSDEGFKIEVRVYAFTQEWNDFFAITEDVLLRINDIVREAGTALAVPSQTLYMARDQGLDTERAKSSAERVRSWRRTGKLPFPYFSAARMAELEKTLDYPPRGSVETWSGGTPPAPADTGNGEFLSARPEEVEREKQDDERGR